MLNTNFRVNIVDFDKDWNDLFHTYWESWKKPPQVAGVLTFAWLSEGNALEEASYETAKKDYLALALANPDMHWAKVEDQSLDGPGVNRIVAGGAWTHHRGNPFLQVTNERATSIQEEAISRIPNISLPGLGYPEGSERHQLMCELYAQLWSWRPKMMSRAHAHGQALWVLPAYRHLGAAQLAMNFWLRQADQLGLECFLEGSYIGTPIYLKSGFVPIVKPVMVFTPPQNDEEPSEDWKQLVRSLHAETICIMWRPSGGIYIEGKTVLPWEGTPRKLKL